MSLMLALLSVLFVIGRAVYEECVASTDLALTSNPGSDVVTVSIKRETSDNTIQIVLTGPKAGWFSVGFGGTTMQDTYAITVEGESTANERILKGYPRGGDIVSTPSATDTQYDNPAGLTRTVTMTRPYASTGTYDFTSFMDCTDSSMDVIVAAATTLTWSVHNAGKASGTITRSCLCPSASPTKAPSKNPTTPPSKQPTASPNTNPSTSPTKNPSSTPTGNPSKQPTASPNSDPSAAPTKNPSSTPTTNPSGTPTANPVTSSGSGYETCVASTEIKSAISITIGRKTSDKTMEIVMTGPVSSWFGVGFGHQVMKDSYAITIDGATAVERILGEQVEGTVVSSSSFTSTTFDDDGTTRTATLVRPWSSDGTYDFSELLCNDGSIDAISAQGGDTTFGFHTNGKAIGTLTSTCSSCPTITTTTADPSGGTTTSDSSGTTTTTPSEEAPTDPAGSAHNIFNAVYICLAVCVSFYFVS